MAKRLDKNTQEGAPDGHPQHTDDKAADTPGGLALLKDAALEAKRLEIGGAIAALPGTFTVNGTGFLWIESFQQLRRNGQLLLLLLRFRRRKRGRRKNYPPVSDLHSHPLR
jgi:hypothetical protein